MKCALAKRSIGAPAGCWRAVRSRPASLVRQASLTAQMPNIGAFATTRLVTLVAVTIPRWPGEGEVEFVGGPWSPSTT